MFGRRAAVTTAFLLATGFAPASLLAAQSPADQDAATTPATEQSTQEAEQTPPQTAGVTDDFLSLGVDTDYQSVERYNTVDQINTFIPPLYQPAFVGHGYVLPPGALRIGAGTSMFDVASNDFFKSGHQDIVHENHGVDRLRTDLSVFLGLDHNMTLFVNLPYWASRSIGSVHPAGVRVMDLFVEGNSQALGDVTAIVKKKWMDQGNFPFNFATVTGVKFATGSSDEPFDAPMVVKTPTGALTPAFGGGPFPRFADDGRLPLPLQPGTGGLGYVLGFMGTRQFDTMRAAFHAGTLMRFLSGSDGAEPGDEYRFFASFVKPVYGESVSLDLTFNGMKKGEDRYSGTFTHPIPTPDGGMAGFATTPRPAFQGGTVMFFSPSLMWSPTPQVRFTGTASIRVNEPDLGPWPGKIIQFGVTYTLPIVRKRLN